MWQRIQTLYLLISAGLIAALCFSTAYSVANPEGLVKVSYWQLQKPYFGILLGILAAMVALALVVLDLAAISGNNNVGGHIAHIGGLAIGIWFALAIRRGTDITAWLNGLLDRLCGSRGARRPAPYTRSAAGNARPSEAQVDAVLDKIRRSGYASLTDRERQILIRASRNNR